MLLLLDVTALCSTTKVGLAKEATGAAPARPPCSTLESPAVGPAIEATGVLLCSAMEVPCAGPETEATGEALGSEKPALCSALESPVAGPAIGATGADLAQCPCSTLESPDVGPVTEATGKASKLRFLLKDSQKRMINVSAWQGAPGWQ